MATSQKKSFLATFFVGLATFLLFFAITIWLFWSKYDERKDKSLDYLRGEERLAILQKSREEAAKQLEAAGWNKDKQIAQIPIDRAMYLVMNELNAKPVSASSVDVPPPLPPTTAAPAPSPSGGNPPAPATNASATAAGNTSPAPAATPSPEVTGP